MPKPQIFGISEKPVITSLSCAVTFKHAQSQRNAQKCSQELLVPRRILLKL